MTPSMRLARILAAGSSALALTVCGLGAFAQEVATAPTAAAPQQRAGISEAVVAIVNDDIISSYDLMQRMRLILVTSGVQPTRKNLRHLSPKPRPWLAANPFRTKNRRGARRNQTTKSFATNPEVNEETN